MIIKIERLKGTSSGIFFKLYNDSLKNIKLLEHCRAVNKTFDQHKFKRIFSDLFIHGVIEIDLVEGDGWVIGNINEEEFFKLKCHSCGNHYDDKCNPFYHNECEYFLKI